MSDGLVLIDTSAWIHALRPGGLVDVREQVKLVLSMGRAATCQMIVLELLGGARTHSDFRELSEDLRALRNLPLTDDVWRVACDLSYSIRWRGFSIPAADHLIAAAALTHGCEILHRDRHFETLARIAGLRISEG